MIHAGVSARSVNQDFQYPEIHYSQDPEDEEAAQSRTETKDDLSFVHDRGEYAARSRFCTVSLI